MISPTVPTANAAEALAAAVATYRRDGDLAALLRGIDAAAAASSTDGLIAAVEPYRDIPEVAGPAYEHVVAARPDDARALVILGNAYWLSGRGPDEVEALASRAIAADPESRGGWHLWALAERDLRGRVARWRQVADRFPSDPLARANLADNAASLAGADSDPEALALAIATYESLRGEATEPGQRAALDQALATLRGWRI